MERIRLSDGTYMSTRDTFRYLYACSPCAWTRIKTCDALMRLARKMPIKTMKKIPPVRVYAPGSVLGEVLALPCNGEILLYLDPCLEKMTQCAVNYVVAHEFAHVVLGHYGNFEHVRKPGLHREQPEEVAADALVVSWGYARMLF
jgi:hypothetical protein